MENQDKLFDQFKKAADNQETPDFAGMEKVWSRVDAKLDTEVFKAQKKTNSGWKKYAVAASVVAGSVFAFQLVKQFQNEKPIQTEIVNTVENTINEVIKDDTSGVATIEEPILDKKEAEKVLEQQLNKANPVVINEKNNIKADTLIPKMATTINPVVENKAEEADFIQPKVYEAISVSKAKEDNYELKKSAAKGVQTSKKADPLVVVDGKATNKKVSDIENADDLETIVELKEPLYIINGKEYTEKELFGPNPTSPYYPLNQQQIESILIYQDEEAIELYGRKGEKGVVVIKTKNGKPAIKQ
jgi:hypothetical protein